MSLEASIRTEQILIKLNYSILRASLRPLNSDFSPSVILYRSFRGISAVIYLFILSLSLLYIHVSSLFLVDDILLFMSVVIKL